MPWIEGRGEGESVEEKLTISEHVWNSESKEQLQNRIQEPVDNAHCFFTMQLWEAFYMLLQNPDSAVHSRDLGNDRQWGTVPSLCHCLHSLSLAHWDHLQINKLALASEMTSYLNCICILFCALLWWEPNSDNWPWDSPSKHILQMKFWNWIIHLCLEKVGLVLTSSIITRLC